MWKSRESARMRGLSCETQPLCSLCPCCTILWHARRRCSGTRTSSLPWTALACSTWFSGLSSVIYSCPSGLLRWASQRLSRCISRGKSMICWQYGFSSVPRPAERSHWLPWDWGRCHQTSRSALCQLARSPFSPRICTLPLWTSYPIQSSHMQTRLHDSQQSLYLSDSLSVTSHTLIPVSNSGPWSCQTWKLSGSAFLHRCLLF